MPTPIIRLPHIYRPRDYQLDFFNALHSGKYRIFVLNWHRRAGKDMTCWNAAIELTAEQVMTTKYAFPTNDMARDNLWESYTNDGRRFTDFVPKAQTARWACWRPHAFTSPPTKTSTAAS